MMLVKNVFIPPGIFEDIITCLKHTVPELGRAIFFLKAIDKPGKAMKQISVLPDMDHSYNQ